MKLYKGYSPKKVNTFYTVTYDIPRKHPRADRYTISLTSSNKLVISLDTFYLFPELYVQVPIGVSNETI